MWVLSSEVMNSWGSATPTLVNALVGTENNECPDLSSESFGDIQKALFFLKDELRQLPDKSRTFGRVADFHFFAKDSLGDEVMTLLLDAIRIFTGLLEEEKTIVWFRFTWSNHMTMIDNDGLIISDWHGLLLSYIIIIIVFDAVCFAILTIVVLTGCCVDSRLSLPPTSAQQPHDSLPIVYLSSQASQAFVRCTAADSDSKGCPHLRKKHSWIGASRWCVAVQCCSLFRHFGDSSITSAFGASSCWYQRWCGPWTIFGILNDDLISNSDSGHVRPDGRH